MKRKYILLLLAVLAFVMTGCEKKEERDTYIDGSDFQYQYLDEYELNKSKGKDCLYYKVGDFIYQFDEKSCMLSPLCNKVNCLHDKEKDQSRMMQCNAYVSSDFDNYGLQYMNGYVYTIIDESDGKHNNAFLYKMKEDGSSKERVYKWTDRLIESWCMHRGNAYVLEHFYDETRKEWYQINKISVEQGKKTKTIFEPDQNISVIGFHGLKAYGNHLYFNLYAMSGKNLDNISDEDFDKYEYNKTFQYHLLDETLTEITAPKQKETEHTTDVIFWKDKIIYTPIDSKNAHEYDKTTNLYIADLDGKNPSILLKDVPQYQRYSSDGEYLYSSNSVEVLDRLFHSEEYKKKLKAGEEYCVKEELAVQIKIYDKDMKLVDEIQTPPNKELPHELPYGIGNRQYVIAKEKDKVILKYWDKEKIGNYHGDTMKYTKIAETEVAQNSEED